MMDSPTNPEVSKFSRRISELRQSLDGVSPELLARRTGAQFQSLPDEKGEFELPIWGKPHTLSWPGLVAHNRQNNEELPPFLQALLLYYFSMADGAPEEGRWVSFADLPGGRFYNQAFQGYTGQVIARRFQTAPEQFDAAAAALGGQRVRLADSAFAFQAFPRVQVLVTCWLGDENFPSSFQVLFDPSISHYLPIDGCAILGSTIAQRLIKFR